MDDITLINRARRFFGNLNHLIDHGHYPYWTRQYRSILDTTRITICEKCDQLPHEEKE